MAEQTILNPTGVYQTVSDHRTMRGDQGQEVSLGKTTRYFRANGTITKGALVTLVAPTTAATPAGVIVTSAASEGLRIVGVAEKAGVAGDLIPVVTEGLAFAVAGGTIAANAHVVGAASGQVVTSTPDATTVAGTLVGVALAAATVGVTIPIFIQRA